MPKKPKPENWYGVITEVGDFVVRTWAEVEVILKANTGPELHRKKHSEEEIREWIEENKKRIRWWGTTEVTEED